MQSQWHMVFLGLTVLLAACVLSMATGKDDEVSPATLQQMAMIEHSINHKVDPCDNFYAYACSKWKTQEIAWGENNSNHVILRKNFLQAVTAMLYTEYPDKESIPKENQSFKDKVGALFYSCMYDHGFDFFDDIKPGNDIEWPLVNALNGKPETSMEHFDLFAFLGQLFSYGFNNFLLNRSVERLSNGSLHIVLNSWQEEELSYYAIRQAHKFSGGTVDEYKKYKAEVLATHDQWLATYNEYNAENREVFSYQQVKQLYPQIAKFLDIMLPHQLNDDDNVEFPNVKYIDFLTKKEWQPQELRKLCNYIMPFFYRYFSDQYDGHCSDILRSKMHFALNYMYRQHYYNSEVKAAFNDLKDKIYKYLLELVNENYLQFNDEQLKAVKDKLAKTYVSVGNVPDIADDAMVEEFYSHMPDLNVNNYSQNLLKTFKQRLWESINCPENMECIDELEHGTYSVPEHDLVIIALASLGPPMYDWTFDPILAVSLLGIFIGHEYGHSIDTGSLVDPKYYESMYEKFENHPNINASIECTEQQYTTEYLRQLEVDLVGARAAFRAYNTEYKIQPSFTKIPWQQLFFLNYAQYFCHWDVMDEETREETIRTNYVAQNMKEFAETFNCPAGSKMNPVEKCLLY